MYNKNKQYGKTESISSPSHSEENEIHCLLEEASNVARGVLESIQAIAGTAVVKGVQIANLERFARDRGYWIEELNKMGFSSELDGDFFSNGNYDIFDALPNNVLVGNDGHLYFIDTIIYKSQDNGFEKYKSLSPRYNQ